MTSIQVTREYIQDPTEFYSLKLVGKDPIKEDIEQQISESLSSPNLNSYTLNIKEPQEDHEAQAVIFHNRSSHQRLGVCHCRVNLTLFQDAREAIRLLQEQVHRLEEKEKERERKEEEMLEWEVFSRIAQAINDEIISDWRARTDRSDLVQELEKSRIHFLPYTMTAEAISWRTKYPADGSVIDIERYYSDEDKKRYINMATQNIDAQEAIDKAWLFLAEDKVTLDLMLTSWAKRNRNRNSNVHMVPSVAFATRSIASDNDFLGEVGERAREYIQRGQNLRGERLFED